MARGPQRMRVSPLSSGMAKWARAQPAPGTRTAATRQPGGQAHVPGAFGAAGVAAGTAPTLNYDAVGRLQPPPAPDPRDADFGFGATRLLHENQSARRGLEQQGTMEAQDLQTTLARMAEARGQDLQGANQNANRQGLFYSGQLGKRRGAIEGEYATRQDDATLAVQRRAEARRAALEEMGTIVEDASNPLGYRGTGRAGLDLSELYGGAVKRRIAANQDLEIPEAAAAAVTEGPQRVDAPAPVAAPVGRRVKLGGARNPGGRYWRFP